jgi:fructokinase
MMVLFGHITNIKEIMKFDIYGLGNALVDSEYVLTDQALEALGVKKAMMELIDDEQLAHILSVLSRNDELGGELHKQASGGSAGNTIMGAQNFGASTFYACRVADDPIGKFFCEDMRLGGVEIDEGLAVMQAGNSGQCMVMVTPDAERTMNTYLGVSSELAIENINEDLLQQSRYLYLEGYMASLDNSIEAACYAKSLVQAAGGKVALSFSDPAMTNFCKAGLQSMISHGNAGVDVLFSNEDEAISFTDADDIHQALNRLSEIASNVVVTLGAKGAMAKVNGEIFHVETDEITVLNTNGAGDSFAAAYLFGIVSGWEVEKSIRLANKTAGAVVQQYGPRLTAEKQQQILAEL